MFIYSTKSGKKLFEYIFLIKEKKRKALFHWPQEKTQINILQKQKETEAITII